MIIRCPQCEHSRSIPESKIPATAEIATCPKCKHRFRFRTLQPELEPLDDVSPGGDKTRPERFVQQPGPGEARSLAHEVQRPQNAFRESAENRGADIFDALDALHRHWQSQTEQHVVEVESPCNRPSDAPAAPAPDPVLPEAPPGRSDRPRPSFSSADSQPPPVAVSPEVPLPGDPAPDAPRAERAPGGPPRAEEGPRPEDRVEKDLLMLLDSSPGRPLRDLGRLREFPDQEDSPGLSPDGESGADSAIPWENPAEYGWIRGFMSTVRGVMFRASDFFAQADGSGSLAPGYLFFLILGYITILCSLAWGQAAVLLLPEAAIPFTGRVALPVLLLLAPIALGLMQLFVTGFIRICLLLFAPERADFTLIYKVVSYSVAPFVLSVVPFVGPPVGALWFIAALMTGCRNGLKLSWRLAAFVPLPPAALLLGGLVWYFL